MTAWPKKKKETHAGPSAVGIAAPVVPVGIALALVEMAVAPAWKNVAPACAASDFIYSFIQVINHLCSRSTVRTTATASRPKTRPRRTFRPRARRGGKPRTSRTKSDAVHHILPCLEFFACATPHSPFPSGVHNTSGIKLRTRVRPAPPPSAPPRRRLRDQTPRAPRRARRGTGCPRAAGTCSPSPRRIIK